MKKVRLRLRHAVLSLVAVVLLAPILFYFFPGQLSDWLIVSIVPVQGPRNEIITAPFADELARRIENQYLSEEATKHLLKRVFRYQINANSMYRTDFTSNSLLPTPNEWLYCDQNAFLCIYDLSGDLIYKESLSPFISFLASAEANANVPPTEIPLSCSPTWIKIVQIDDAESTVLIDAKIHYKPALVGE